MVKNDGIQFVPAVVVEKGGHFQLFSRSEHNDRPLQADAAGVFRRVEAQRGDLLADGEMRLKIPFNAAQEEVRSSEKAESSSALLESWALAAK